MPSSLPAPGRESRPSRWLRPPIGHLTLRGKRDRRRRCRGCPRQARACGPWLRGRRREGCEPVSPCGLPARRHRARHTLLPPGRSIIRPSVYGNVVMLPGTVDVHGMRPGGDPRVLAADQSVTPAAGAPLSGHLALVPHQGSQRGRGHEWLLKMKKTSLYALGIFLTVVGISKNPMLLIFPMWIFTY